MAAIMLWLFPPLLGRQFHEDRAHLGLAPLWVPRTSRGAWRSAGPHVDGLAVDGGTQWALCKVILTPCLPFCNCCGAVASGWGWQLGSVCWQPFGSCHLPDTLSLSSGSLGWEPCGLILRRPWIPAGMSSLVGWAGPSWNPLGSDSCATFTPTPPSLHSLSLLPAAISSVVGEPLVLWAALPFVQSKAPSQLNSLGSSEQQGWWEGGRVGLPEDESKRQGSDPAEGHALGW